jgi:hypothetical protein
VKGLAEELVELVEKMHHLAEGDDEQLAELLLPGLLAHLGAELGPRRLRARIDRELEPGPIPAASPMALVAAAIAKEPFPDIAGLKAAAEALEDSGQRPWCSRWLNCGSRADLDVWDARTGTYRPMCTAHAAGEGSLLTRPIGTVRCAT